MSDKQTVTTAFIQLIQPFVRQAAAGGITDDTRLIDDLKVNSARMIDIILETEDKFGISIDDDSADHLRTVGDAVNMILAKSTGA